jgi:hypothetical protein
MKAFGMFVLGLISTTFGLVIFLFVLSYFPDPAVSAFATSLLNAGGSLLGAIPEIVGFVMDRIRNR